MSGKASRFNEHLVDPSELNQQLARSRTVPEFTMQMVSNETGVPADTLRSWERRYRFPNPQRTGSNRRLYSQRDVVAITWIRDQTGRGQGVREAIASLHRPAEASDSPPPLSPVKTLGVALLDDDLSAAQAAWDELALALSAEGLCERALLPAYQRLAGEPIPIPARMRADAFLLRKAIVMFDASAPHLGLRDISIVTHGDRRALLPATVLGIVLSRAGFRITLPIADLSATETLVSLQGESFPSIIVVTPQPNPALDPLLSTLTGSDLRFWWPHSAPDDPESRWLPTGLGEAAAALS